MGVFDCLCVESGLPIDSDQRLVLIIETPAKTWEPIALPVRGTNNRYGTMDEPSSHDANMKAIIELEKRLDLDEEPSGDDELVALLDVIRPDGSGGTLAGARVTFSLFDDTIFNAIVKVVSENGAAAWTRYARVALGERRPALPNEEPRPTPPPPEARLQQLCEQLIAAPTDDGARKVFVDHLLERDDPRGKLLALLPSLGTASWDDVAAVVFPSTPKVYASETKALRPALTEFARFRAWGTELVPSHGADQFSSWDGEYGAVAPFFARAKLLYPGTTAVRAAIADVESAWKSRVGA
jgi:hypothetical protein